MDTIFDFNNFQPQEDEHIPIEHSAEFYSTAQDLSQYIHGLPISQPENDNLIQFILNHVKAITQDTFNQAFRMGMEFREFTEIEQDISKN